MTNGQMEAALKDSEMEDVIPALRLVRDHLTQYEEFDDTVVQIDQTIRTFYLDAMASAVE